MYLFDTCVLSEVIKRSPPQRLMERLATVPYEQAFTTTITVGEIVYGAYKSQNPQYFLALAERTIWPNFNILPFDKPAAELYGRVRAQLQLAGTPIAEPDLRIASIALDKQLIMVTRNVRHFTPVPSLRVENWVDQ